MTNDFSVNDCENNFIKETVAKIDKLQKEVISDFGGRCISCETSLFTSANNTIPVAFYTCDGVLLSALSNTYGNTTTFFRVESIRGGKYVTLRLLSSVGEAENRALEATDYTMILNLDAIIGIQCFEPITVAVCTSSEGI